MQANRPYRRSFVAWLDDLIAPLGWYAWRNRKRTFGIQFGKWSKRR